MTRIEVGTVAKTVTANISGQTVIVSGQPVLISGERVRLEGYYHAGATWIPLSVDASGDIRVEATAEISGQPVWVSSGEIHVVSGDVRAEQLGSWDVSVSGSVTVISGLVSASVSGNIVDIVTPSEIKTNAVANASGNPVRIPSADVALVSNDCISVTIKALSVNSGDIYVGGHTSGQTPSSGFGLLLEAGEAVNIDIDNIGKIHVYAVVSGDRITYIANN